MPCVKALYYRNITKSYIIGIIHLGRTGILTLRQPHTKTAMIQVIQENYTRNKCEFAIAAAYFCGPTDRPTEWAKSNAISSHIVLMRTIVIHLVSQSTIFRLFSCYTERNVNQCIVNRVTVAVRVTVRLWLWLGYGYGYAISTNRKTCVFNLFGAMLSSSRDVITKLTLLATWHNPEIYPSAASFMFFVIGQ